MEAWKSRKRKSNEKAEKLGTRHPKKITTRWLIPVIPVITAIVIPLSMKNIP